MNIKVDKDALPARIEEIKTLKTELEEIGANVTELLPFAAVRQSQGPNAANMQIFQESLLQIITCGNEVMQAAVDYLQNSYTKFLSADSK